MCLQRWVGALTPIFPQNHDGENPDCGGSPTVPFPLFPQVVLGTAVGLVSGGDASHPHLAGCCCGCSRFGSSAGALPLPPSLSEFSLAQHWDEKLFFLSSKQALRDVRHALGAFLGTNAFPWSVALRVLPVSGTFPGFCLQVWHDELGVGVPARVLSLLFVAPGKGRVQFGAWSEGESGLGEGC